MQFSTAQAIVGGFAAGVGALAINGSVMRAARQDSPSRHDPMVQIAPTALFFGTLGSAGYALTHLGSATKVPAAVLGAVALGSLAGGLIGAFAPIPNAS